MAFKFIWIFLLCCIATIATADISPELNFNEVSAWLEYKILIRNNQKESTYFQISSLKKFLLKNPHFEKIYLKILHTYIMLDSLHEAKRYFLNVSSDENTSFLSEWMLAKIYIIENDQIMEMGNIEKYENIVAFCVPGEEPVRMKELIESKGFIF